MSLFSNSGRSRSRSLSRQIEDLRDELAELAESVSDRGSAAFKQTRRGANDLYGDLADSISHAMPVLRRQGRMVGREVRKHPAPAAAAVGLVLIGIVAAAYLGRR